MKRSSEGNIPNAKRKPYKPHNIIVGSKNKDETGTAIPVLGGKTKGAVYLEETKESKKSFGSYMHGNYQGYYT
jgi:hypothetical protein